MSKRLRFFNGEILDAEDSLNQQIEDDDGDVLVKTEDDDAEDDAEADE